jgi:hypothetical protein
LHDCLEAPGCVSGHLRVIDALTETLRG